MSELLVLPPAYGGLLLERERELLLLLLES